MRDALTELIFEQHSKLYSGHVGGLSTGLVPFIFEHGDGWFGIIDALSRVLSGHSTESGLETRADQVKEKFGTLSFYASTDLLGQGAIDLAEAYSARVCELTGRPGLLMLDGAWMMTRAAKIMPGTKVLDDAQGRIPSVTARIARLPASQVMTMVLAARSHVLGSVTGLPPGWADLVDSLAGYLTREGWHGENVVPWRLHGLRVGTDGRLEALVTGDVAEECEGALAFAHEMSGRIDPVTGACGPVDDTGLLSDEASSS